MWRKTETVSCEGALGARIIGPCFRGYLVPAQLVCTAGNTSVFSGCSFVIDCAHKLHGSSWGAEGAEGLDSAVSGPCLRFSLMTFYWLHGVTTSCLHFGGLHQSVKWLARE